MFSGEIMKHHLFCLAFESFVHTFIRSVGQDGCACEALSVSLIFQVVIVFFSCLVVRFDERKRRELDDVVIDDLSTTTNHH